MKATEILLVIVLILVAGGLIYGFLSPDKGDSPDNLPLPPTNETPEAKQPETKVEPATGKALETPGKASGPIRVKGTDPDNGRKKVLKRGVKGLVLDPNGAPLPGCKVFLAQTFGVKNFFQAMALTRRMPVRDFCKTLTDDKGTFIVGFNGEEKEADLFVTHPGYQTVVKAKVLVPGDKVYALDLPIQMKPGMVVKGIVTSQVTNAPISSATVRLTYQGTSVFQSVPGEEEGVAVKTDEQGHFLFSTLMPGSHNFEAFAKGHAKETKANQALSSNTQVLQLDFNLPGGSSISGVVVNGDGNPVSGARIEASSHSNKNPCTAVARSKRDGSFDVLGLPVGVYRLTASYSGYVDDVRNMAKTGEEKVGMVLQKKGSVIVQVLGRNGRPLRSFFLELRTARKNQDVYGKTNVPAKNVRNARAGRYEFSGLEPDLTYLFRVESKNYAMTFSETFQVELGKGPAQVTVQMKEGGRITGKIVDAQGRPVANAMVYSMSPKYKDNPFMDILGGLVPISYSRISARTNRDGQFTLPGIMPQTYQIKITHPSYPKTYKGPIEVTEGMTNDIGEVAMPVGIIVHGTAYDEKGQPIPLAKVSMGSEGNTQFGNETRADEKGNFQFPPAPPGKYKLQCGRMNGGNPFGLLLDFKKSLTLVNLTGAQNRQKVDLQITDN